jgi:flavin-dependent thymidylate synthase
MTVDKATYDSAPIKGLRVHLLSATPDPLGAIAAACMMYEGKVVDSLLTIKASDRLHYWEESKKTHLKAPWEFVDLHFMLEGVSRAFTHQLVRQRTAVFAQESLRFAIKKNLEVETPVPAGVETEDQIDTWYTALADVQAYYDRLLDLGVPAEDARGLLPHATTTRVHYKTSLRSLIDVAGNRLCTQAQFEWREVFRQIVSVLSGAGWQYAEISKPDPATFSPVCFRMGRCPFMAGFDRGCTIRDRVERGEQALVDPKEYMDDPKAGWVRDA